MGGGYLGGGYGGGGTAAITESWNDYVGEAAKKATAFLVEGVVAARRRPAIIVVATAMFVTVGTMCGGSIYVLSWWRVWVWRRHGGMGGGSVDGACSCEVGVTW